MDHEEIEHIGTCQKQRSVSLFAHRVGIAFMELVHRAGRLGRGGSLKDHAHLVRGGIKTRHLVLGVLEPASLDRTERVYVSVELKDDSGSDGDVFGTRMDR